MDLARTVDELKSALNRTRVAGGRTGFVPTMGALHEGHGALMDLAKKQVDTLVCSVFVNPLQFHKEEDLRNYPRTESKDLVFMEQRGVDLAFVPTYEEIFPVDYPMPTYDLGDLDKVLEGAFRPGHFQGVARVVGRLLDLLACQGLFMGMKDYQQCLVVERLLQLRGQGQAGPDLIKVETVREASGLALSSRNLLLNAEQLDRARGIGRTWTWMKKQWGSCSPEELVNQALNRLSDQGLRHEYMALVQDGSLQPWTAVPEGTGPRVLYAGWLDGVRLIDNERLGP